jgi:hypothetical protein
VVPVKLNVTVEPLRVAAIATEVPLNSARTPWGRKLNPRGKGIGNDQVADWGTRKISHRKAVDYRISRFSRRAIACFDNLDLAVLTDTGVEIQHP